MRRQLRQALQALAGLLGVALAVAWLSGAFEDRVAPEQSERPARRVPAAEIATVEERSGPAVEWASGEVASARHSSVSSRVLARIEEVRVAAGSDVSQGDVVIVLDARDLLARVREANEALRASKARLELSERELERVQELYRTNVAPQQRLDEAQTALRAARAEMSGRQQALEEARTAASFAEIRSPVSGRVVDRLAEPGDTAVPGRPLLRVYDPALLRVEAAVRESLAVDLSVGDRVAVEVPALGESVQGRVDEIVPYSERGSRTLLVKVRLPRTDGRLFAGMFARIAIPAGERRSLVVPEAAVDRIGQLEFVTAVTPEGMAERRLVTTGTHPAPGWVEVLSGLEAGERVHATAPSAGDGS